MINVLFFGKLREQLGESSLSFDQTSATSIQALKTLLYAKHPDWQLMLDDPSTQIAVNQQLMLDSEVELHDGDEVAFFPPVTGG